MYSFEDVCLRKHNNLIPVTKLLLLQERQSLKKVIKQENLSNLTLPSAHYF